MAATALALGIATFTVLSRGMSLTRRPHVEALLFVSNLIVLLLAGGDAGRAAGAWWWRSGAPDSRAPGCMCGW